MIFETNYIEYAFCQNMTGYDATLDSRYDYLIENLHDLHKYSFSEVTAMMQDWADLAYEQYEQHYDSCYEQHLAQVEEDERAWLDYGRAADEFKQNSFPRKLAFKAWRAASDYRIAKQYVWQNVKKERQAQKRRRRKALYLALSTINARANGFRIIAAGHDKAAVENAARAAIGNGIDIYSDTYRKNLAIVSKTVAKRKFGVNWEDPCNPPYGWGAMGEYKWVD